MEGINNMCLKYNTQQIFKQLDEELIALKAKFMPKTKAIKPVFSFKDEDEI